MKKTLLLALTLLPSLAISSDIITTKQLSHELATSLAQQAVKTCVDMGYQVTAVVVDRSATPQVLIRSSLAPRFTIQIATDKANATILSGIKSGDLRNNRQDIRAELNHIDGLVMMRGAIPITASGSLLGAIGVSGAPGGEKDELCAQKALDKIAEQLEFAD